MGKGKYVKWLEPDNLFLLTNWARDGLTEEQLAKKMGVAYSTLKDWKNKFPAFSAAIKDGKEVADYQVESALYNKALGYTVTLQKTFKLKRVEYDPETGKKLFEREELTTGPDQIHVPADTTAQIFWLKNRKPETWRDKPDTSSAEVFEALDRVIGGIDSLAAE